MKLCRVHLHVTATSAPALFADLSRLPEGRARAARLRVLAELGLRVEAHLLAAAAAGLPAPSAPAGAAPALGEAAPPPIHGAVAAAPLAQSPKVAPQPQPASEPAHLVADPNDLIGGLLKSF